ncbi:IMP dehydrogenase, partial [Streptomyces sp. NRRL F-6602]
IYPTAWFGARLAEIGAGDTVAIVGAGPVGQAAIACARLQGAGRVIVVDGMGDRLELARDQHAETIDFNAEDPVEAVVQLTGGIGADSVLECVGTAEAMRQALHAARPGGNVGFVGVPHEVAVDGQELFFSHVGLRGGPAPVRRYLPDLVQRVLAGRIDPGKVFDLTLPLDQIAEGYRAMDERRAIKT